MKTATETAAGKKTFRMEGIAEEGTIVMAGIEIGGQTFERMLTLDEQGEFRMELSIDSREPSCQMNLHFRNGSHEKSTKEALTQWKRSDP